MVGIAVEVNAAGSGLGEAVGVTGVALADGSTVKVAVNVGTAEGKPGDVCSPGENARQATSSIMKGRNPLRIALIIAVSLAILKTLSSLSYTPVHPW